MGRLPLPEDEEGRLADLREADVLDTEPEPEWDDIVLLAARICSTPIAVVNFVDADRQWAKAFVGLEAWEAPRADSFCARTVASGGVLEIGDARPDPQGPDDPGVLGDPRLRFYAGAPIVTPRGHAVGTVCVADRVPRALDDAQRAALTALARQAASQLELRHRSRARADGHDPTRIGGLHDELTGLANRPLFTDRVAQSLARRRRDPRGSTAVLYVDLDGFRQVNDHLGPGAGDELLRIVAHRLRRTVRAADTVARLGGDGFAVLADLSVLEDVTALADRISVALSEPALVTDAEIVPFGSVGVAFARREDGADDLLHRADRALDEAKRSRFPRAR